MTTQFSGGSLIVECKTVDHLLDRAWRSLESRQSSLAAKLFSDAADLALSASDQYEQALCFYESGTGLSQAGDDYSGSAIVFLTIALNLFSTTRGPESQVCVGIKRKIADTLEATQARR